MTDHLAHLRREAAEASATIKDRYAAWHERHGDKLAAWHPAVAAEIRTTVFERIREGLSPGLTDAERRDCLMRVASRIRVAQGPVTSDAAARQLREAVAAVEAQGQRSAA